MKFGQRGDVGNISNRYNSLGSNSKYAQGGWRGQIVLQTFDGKVRKCIYGKTRKEVQEKQRLLNSKNISGFS